MRNHQLPEIHPGEILHQEFLRSLGIALEELAAGTALSTDRLHSLLRGDVPVTADVAQSLGHFFNVSSTFWTNLQQDYDKRKGLPG